MRNIDRYWQQFLESLPPTDELPQRYYDAFYFGTTKESAKLISSLVLQGVKTATGSLLWRYEAERKRLPKPGDYSIVTRGEDDPVCVIQTMEVRIVPYDEVDEKFAFDGGEDDRTLESWRRIYWDYVLFECARINRQPSTKIPIVCERFRVVYKDTLRPK